MKNLIAWVEIPTTNFERALDFYGKILNIDFEPVDCGQEKMACFPNNEGAIIQAEGFEPSGQGVVVSLNAGNDLDGCLERIEKQGGKVIRPKTRIDAEGMGYFALFTDTESNRIGLYGDK
mgnify:CR=1 FL=1